MSQSLQPPPRPDIDEFEKKYPELSKWLRLLTGLFKRPVIREISDAAGKNPIFENLWVNHGGVGVEVAGFYKDVLGRGWIEGSVKDGTVPGIAFTLPVGYRPRAAVNYSSVDATGTPSARISINVDGEVTIEAGNNALITLDGISWRT